MSEIAGTVYIEPNVRIELVGPDGLVKEVRVCNTVTTAGKNGAADQILASPSLTKPTHMALGTGTPGANALGTEVERNAFSTKTRSGAVVTMTASFGPGEATGAITEAGTFDASSSGNMWMSSSFLVVNKGVDDTINISWDLAYS